jgi:hypothetical protein
MQLDGPEDGAAATVGPITGDRSTPSPGTSEIPPIEPLGKVDDVNQDKLIPTFAAFQ